MAYFFCFVLLEKSKFYTAVLYIVTIYNLISLIIFYVLYLRPAKPF